MATDNIEEFIARFRAGREPSQGPCIVCGGDGVKYCESCCARLCEVHADSDTYPDVDVCADSAECDQRCEVN